jgi:hypothetical protein
MNQKLCLGSKSSIDLIFQSIVWLIPLFITGVFLWILGDLLWHGSGEIGDRRKIKSRSETLQDGSQVKLSST